MDKLLRQNGLNQSWKVKVYLLNGSGNWDDCGTGVLEETQDPDENEYLKILTNDELIKGRSTDISSERYENLKGKLAADDEVLLFLPVIKRNKYDKQGECIITWIDDDLDEEIAISFLDQHITSEVWRFICMKIGKNPTESKKVNHKDLEMLPLPEVNTLEKIKHELESRRDWAICAIQGNPKFLRKLKKVFEELELMQNFDKLAALCEIVKCLVFCEDSHFIEQLLSEEYYLFIFGIFEYETENSNSKRPKHRQFLSEKAVFKNIFEIEDPKIITKIQTNHRVTYLRDSVVNFYIEDQTTNVLNTIIYYNNYDIFEHIIGHPSYLKKFFELFSQRLEDSISFLSEFITIIKTIMQNDAKSVFLEKLMENNAFLHFINALEMLDTAQGIEPQKISQLKIQLVEAIIFLCQIQILPFFNFIKANDLLIKVLINNMYSGDYGLQILLGDLFKLLLDSSHDNKNEIHGFMYGKVLPMFTEQINKLENRQYVVNFMQEVLELFSYCIVFHGFRIRYFIIQHKLLQEFYKGFKLRNKAITLSIIRFVRSIMISKDEFLIKFIINNNLLDDIFNAYFQNANKYNLIESACLELFEKIHSENLKKLIKHIVERFKGDIVKRNLQKVFEKIFAVYEEITGHEAAEGKKLIPLSKEVYGVNNENAECEEEHKADHASQANEMRAEEEEKEEKTANKENVGMQKSEEDAAKDRPEQDNNKANEMRAEAEEEEEKVANKENIDMQKSEQNVAKDHPEQDKDKANAIAEQPVLNNPLSENEAGALDMRSKIKNAMLTKTRKEDEDRPKASPDSKSMDKSSNSIKIQLTLASAETSSESGDEKDERVESVSGKDKRQASENMIAEIEAYGGDLQKRIKL